MAAPERPPAETGQVYLQGWGEAGTGQGHMRALAQAAGEWPDLWVAGGVKRVWLLPNPRSHINSLG